MILKAWGIPLHTPLALSEALTKLSVSHSIAGHVNGSFYTRNIDGLCEEQPAWPIIAQTIRDARLVKRPENFNTIFFICDSYTALQHSNAELVDTLEEPVSLMRRLLVDSTSKASRMKTILPTNKTFVLKQREPSIDEYVKAASRPSVLNEMQTLVYKINPYSERKQVQSSLILYLAGNLKRTKLVRQLNQSLKTKELIRLMDTDTTHRLKDAISSVQTGVKSVEDASKTFKVEPFDITYVLTSSKKLTTSVKEKH